ncbi:MAG: outer membrane beta-barrel protein [Aeromonas popoffii]|uniref:outer membrane beta-barrel protein n=1 Tax=Aeromonas popoffii TaxID=70856 RepID=UPI003F348A6C
MKKSIVAVLFASAFSFSGAALALDINPMVGVQINAESDGRGASDVAPVFGGELITDDNFIFGASISGDERDDIRATNGFVTIPVTVTTASISAWGGTILDNNIALKAGVTVMASEMENQYNGASISGSQTQLMVGTGYYFDNGLNVSLHLNIPVAGDLYEGTEAADYLNAQLLLGYRF